MLCAVDYTFNFLCPFNSPQPMKEFVFAVASRATGSLQIKPSVSGNENGLPSIKLYKGRRGKNLYIYFAFCGINARNSALYSLSSKQIKSSSNRISIVSNAGKNLFQTVTIYLIKQPHLPLNIPKIGLTFMVPYFCSVTSAARKRLHRFASPSAYPKDKTINFTKQLFSTVPFQCGKRYFPGIREARRCSHY